MWFTKDVVLQTEVSKFFAERNPNFWKTGNSKLRDRYNKYCAQVADYVEK